MMTYFFRLLQLLTSHRVARRGQALGRLALLLAAPLLGRAQVQVTTLAPTNITGNSATLNGQIGNPNGNAVNSFGLVYRQGTGTPPTTADNVLSGTQVATAASCAGCYSGTAPLLQPGTPYQVRAFATTAAGTGYGATQTFETPPTAYQPPLPAISVTPAGPLALGAGGTITLAASLSLPGLNLTGSGLNAEVYAVLVQPDGSVLVGGNFTTYNSNGPGRLLRLLADGARDESFNPVGAGPNGAVRTLALQPDGKLLVGGDFTTYNGAAAPGRLLRLNADGSLDATFNPGGSGPDGTVAALALQPDGKVLVGGGFTTYNGAAAPGRVLRLNANGSLDATFNTPNGQPGAGPNANGTANFAGNTGVAALALQPDGKVLVGGGFTTYNGAAAPGRVLRLNANGSLDATFNAPNGQPGAGPNNNSVNALALQPDGKVLVGGPFTTYNGAAAPGRVLRLNADGSLDPGFNNGGTGLDSGVRVLLLQPDGKVLLGGVFMSYNGNANAPNRLLRLNANGSLDPGFNNGPTAGTGVGGNANLVAPVHALALLPGGQVVVGGTFTDYNGDAGAPDNLLRVNPDGSLDTAPLVTAAAAGLTFTWSTGATGPNLTVGQPGDYRATATRQGRFYYSRLVRVSAPPAVAVRVAPGGPLVLPSGGPIALTATATRPGFDVGGAGFNGDVRAVVLQADGKVLVGGGFTTYNGSTVPQGLVRLNPDGSLDAGFASGISGPLSVFALALQPDGKVLVGSSAPAGSGNSQSLTTTAPVNLVRLLPDGRLDTSFAPGRVLAAYGTQTGFAWLGSCIFALALQPDGKIVVGGDFNSHNGDIRLTAVLRVNPDGSPDRSFNFGGNGIKLQVPNNPISQVFALAVQPNGKIVVGGRFNYYNSLPVPRSVIRLNDDGSYDTGFNTVLGSSTSGGILHFDYPDRAGFVYALAVQPDGKILVGGQFQQWNLTGAFAIDANRLLRLNEDGTPDASFNTPGDLNINGAESRGNSPVWALAVQPDGRIVVGGEFLEYDSRYNNGASHANFFRNRLLRLEPNGSLDPATDFSHPAAQFGADNHVYALALQPDGQVLVGGAFTSYDGNAAAPDRLLRLAPAGPLNDAATPLAGATYAFNPGSTSGSSRAVSQPGTYTATATDPATGFSYLSNAVTVNGAPLPVELTTFTATLASPAAVRLAWATASEKNSATFEVERSLDGTRFGHIGTVAAAGSSSALRRYELLDGQLPAGATLLYYRLRQVDQDGTFSYSPVRAVALGGAAGQGLALFPNPAPGGTATLMGAQPGAVVTVFDALGRQVATATADAAGTAALALPDGLATGVYVVRVGSQALRLTLE